MKTKLLLLMTFCLFSVLPAGAQWSNNPLDNTQISYSGDEAAVPYVATHPCGTTYISWFTPGSGGNYYPWMQCLDAAGNFQWSIPGLFVSGHPSMTWITDYSMIVCPDTCSVISFQDMRATANDIFIYKISPSGAFLWGPNGVQLSDNPDFEADPVLAAFPDNSVAVAWPRSPNTGDETVIMQRLSSAGVKQWSSDLVLGESGYNYTWPRVVAAENGNTLLVNYKEWGPYYAPNRIILAQKYDPSGNAVWSAPATLFTGATPVYVHPIVAADGLGGAFVCWFYEKVANHLSTFVQHVDAGGNVTMAPNGVEVNTNSSTLHLEPNIGCDTVNHELYVFWRETDLNQNSYGLFGQRVSMDGTLHWGTNAKLFVQLSNKNVTIINVSPMKAGAIVSYFYDDWVTSTQTKVRAIRVDSSGNTVWTGGYRDVSTKQSGKGNLYAGPLANSQVVYAWWDDRLGGQQIFAQNLCENGNLGPVDNSFTYYPDTVFFQTSQDVEYGKSFSLVNPHSYSLDIQYIQQEGTLFGSPETWYTRPHYSSFPVTMDPNETVTDTVHWVVLKKSLSGYFYDTLEVRSLTQTSRIIIAIDSSLVITGVPDIKGLNVQAFPNPFPDWIRISGQVQPGKVTISVFNTLMQPVRGPVEIAAPGGRMEWRWDRTDDAGQRVPSGIYFITVKSAEGSKTFRVIAI